MEVRKAHAYTDESGNTGLNVFDGSQPFFHTFTMISELELNVELAPAVKRWSDIVCHAELHGSALGTQGIELIAQEIRSALSTAQCRFVVTTVEKEHSARLKLADTVLDSGLNPKVGGIHYHNRWLRFGLAEVFLVDEIFQRRQVRRFWDAYRNQDLPAFAHVVDQIRWRLAMADIDARRQELLSEALEFAYTHPRELLTSRRSELDSPNVVAFSLLVNSLHRLLGEGIRVESFVHDEQNEFAKSFRWIYDLLTQCELTDDRLDLPSIRDAQTSFDCPLLMQESASAPALQLVDVLLWLYKRDINIGLDRTSACGDLVSFVIDRCMLNEFTRYQFRRDLALARNRIMSLPLTDEQLEQGRELANKLERKRKKRLLSRSDATPSE